MSSWEFGTCLGVTRWRPFCNSAQVGAKGSAGERLRLPHQQRKCLPATRLTLAEAGHTEIGWFIGGLHSDLHETCHSVCHDHGVKRGLLISSGDMYVAYCHACDRMIPTRRARTCVRSLDLEQYIYIYWDNMIKSLKYIFSTYSVQRGQVWPGFKTSPGCPVAEVHSEVLGAEGLTRWYVVRIPLLKCTLVTLSK